MHLLFLIGVFACGLSSSLGFQYQIKPDTSRINYFSSEFLKSTPSNGAKNHAVSPFIAALAISQACIGADGMTRFELETFLPFSPYNRNDQFTIKYFVGDFNYFHRDDVDVRLFVTNQMFIADNLVATSEFSQTLWNLFETRPQPINLANTFDTSETIKNWIAASSKGRITTSITTEQLRRDADLVLMSTAYFKGYWTKPFDPSRTAPTTFWVDGMIPQPTPTMHNVGSYRSGNIDSLNAQFIKLNYMTSSINNILTMIIIRPNEINGISTVLANLDNIDVNALKSETVATAVKLPKFKIETSIDLSKPLGRLGVKQMFGSNPDLSYMTDRPIKVVQAIQKVVVEVDEGNKKFPDTPHSVQKMTVMPTYNGKFEKEFNVDRPFVFMIVTSGLVLFNGLVTSPMDGLAPPAINPTSPTHRWVPPIFNPTSPTYRWIPPTNPTYPWFSPTYSGKPSWNNDGNGVTETKKPLL